MEAGRTLIIQGVDYVLVSFVIIYTFVAYQCASCLLQVAVEKSLVLNESIFSVSS